MPLPPLYIVKRTVVTVFSHIWNLTEWCRRQRSQVPVSLSSCIGYWCWVAELHLPLLFSMPFNPAFCPRTLLLQEYFSRAFSIALVEFIHWRQLQETKGEKTVAGPLSNAPPSWVLWWAYFCWYSWCLSGTHPHITQVLAPPSPVPLRNPYWCQATHHPSPCLLSHTPSHMCSLFISIFSNRPVLMCHLSPVKVLTDTILKMLAKGCKPHQNISIL